MTLAVCLRAQDTGRTALPTWQVQKYDIEVTLPQDNSRVIASRAVIGLKNVSGRPASTLTLRIAPAAEISAIKINDSTADFSKSEEKINAAASLQRVVTRLVSVPADGVISAVVDYKITVKDNAALGTISPNGSQLLPLSYWYPTPNSWFFTRGGDTAPFRLKVNGQTALSAGAEASGVFDQKLNGQPFFVTGNWDVTNQPGVAVYAPKGTNAEGQKRIQELAALFLDARTFIAGVLGKAPEVPLRIVSVRRGAGFSNGGTVLVDEALFRRPKVDSLTAMNVAEAAAKLWLGNAVAVNGEGYGIITEGLSRYLATEFIESKFGKDVADIERLRQRNAYTAVSKRDAPMTIVSPIDDFYYPVVANKGAMMWRLLAKRVGASEFSTAIKGRAEDGNLNIAELRTAFASQKGILDPLFDQITETNLIIGLPRIDSGDTKVALRNTGQNDVTVNLAATTASGQKIISPATIAAASYGEGVFKTTEKVVRVEIDPEKLYPQTDYADDVKPQDTADSDPLLAVKRSFDRQSAPEFANAETLAKTLIRDLPRFDDLRILLARSQLALGKNQDAEREFKAVLDEKLPTARSLAWAYVGLAEIAAKANQNEAAIKWAEAAIATDAEYGASFAARNLRSRLEVAGTIDPTVRAFFADFDKAAAANRKADMEALAMPGEVTRFVSGLTGSTEQWQTQIRHIDRIDANTVLVEANMSIKLLNKEIETGVAVYRLTRAGNGWKLNSVDMFEVR